MRDIIERFCQTLDVAPSVQQYMLFSQYLDMLERWNRAYNLTAIRDRQRMVTHHLLDSLAVSPFLSGPRLLDVGTGAGLPGIPLAILHADMEFVLLDSNGKKIRFLRQLVADLELANVTVIQQRAEQLVDKCGFDMVLSRAFATLTAMLGCTKHLLAPDGQWLAMKGMYPTEEIADLHQGIDLQAVHRITVPGLMAERHVAIMRRVTNTQ
jgi:16S rRNA (guanine527-N7)-methyltransferase